VWFGVDVGLLCSFDWPYVLFNQLDSAEIIPK